MKQLSNSDINIILITSAALTTLRSNILATTSTAPAIGQKYKLTDGLLLNRIVEWNGEAFNSANKAALTISNNHPSVPNLYAARRDSDNATDVTQAVMASVTIPGFLLGSTSKLTIVPFWNTDNVNTGLANTKNTVVQLFTTGNGAGVFSAVPLSGSTTVTRQFLECMNSSLTSQLALNNQSSYGSAQGVLRHSYDFKTDVDIRFICYWSAICPTASFIELLGYSIELMP